MGRKCNDVYGEEKVYYYPGAIVRVRRPILTEEERAVLLSATRRYVTGCKNAMKGL